MDVLHSFQSESLHKSSRSHGSDYLASNAIREARPIRIDRGGPVQSVENFLENVPTCTGDELPRYIAGASAGALLGTALIGGSPTLNSIWEIFKNVAKECSAHPTGPFSRKVIMEHHIREGLRDLPPDIHERVSRRLFISVTKLYGFKNVLFNNWNSKEDLINCLLCSCYIPGFSGGSIPIYKGEKCIDGGFTSNQPKPIKPYLTISPFCSEADICPKDPTGSPGITVKVSDESLVLTRQNIHRLYRALIPYNLELLENLYREGYNDTQQYLDQKPNIIRGVKCS